MQPYRDNVVTMAMLLRGYADAYARFKEAARDDSDVASATFAPLFEALNWAVALDDRIRKHWAPEGQALGFAWRERVPAAGAMRGVRWARNAVHHQWADALEVVRADQAPMRRYPARPHEWLWREADHLPRPSKGREDAEGEAAYRRILAGHTCEDTLAILGEAFDDVWRMVEFPGSLGMQGTGFDGPRRDRSDEQPTF